MIRHDSEKFLGKEIGKKYPCSKNSLPFLLKVLSVRTALSIQAHPDRDLAQKLHVKFPDVYKDPNPKPEIAIALSDDFEACFGFAEKSTILKNFNSNPPLQTLIARFDLQSDNFLQEFCHFLFNDLDHDKNRLMNVIKELNDFCLQ